MIARTIGLTLKALGERKLSLLGAIFLPTAFLIAIQTFIPKIATAGFLFAYLPLIAYSWLAVSVHRIILLKDGFRIRWGRRETRFAVTLFIVLLALALTVTLLIGALESIGIPSTGIAATAVRLIATAGILYWAAQYFLIFPAIAVDRRRYTYTHSSVDTEENRIDVFFVIAIVPLLLSLIDVPANLLTDPLLLAASRALLSVLSITFGAAMLSVLYRELTPRQ